MLLSRFLFFAFDPILFIFFFARCNSRPSRVWACREMQRDAKARLILFSYHFIYISWTHRVGSCALRVRPAGELFLRGTERPDLWSNDANIICKMTWWCSIEKKNWKENRGEYKMLSDTMCLRQLGRPWWMLLDSSFFFLLVQRETFSPFEPIFFSSFWAFIVFFLLLVRQCESRLFLHIYFYIISKKSNGPCKDFPLERPCRGHQRGQVWNFEQTTTTLVYMFWGLLLPDKQQLCIWSDAIRELVCRAWRGARPFLCPMRFAGGGKVTVCALVALPPSVKRP